MNRHQLRQLAEQQPAAHHRALGDADRGIVLVFVLAVLAIASMVGIVGWL